MPVPMTPTKHLNKVFNPHVPHCFWGERPGAVYISRCTRLANRKQVKTPLKCTCTEPMVFGPKKHLEQPWIWLRPLVHRMPAKES